ncbi:MAG TPA: sodium:solute symporter family protein [bacterium]|jgi:SSS family solute:Na+ symporter
MPSSFRLHPLDIAVPALYFVAVLIIGLVQRGRRHGVEEYLLMGRKLTAPAFIMSLVSAWYGGILGVSEYSYNYGLSNWFVFGVPYYLHALIFAIFFARLARRTKNYSIPDRLETVYGSGAARIGALVIVVITMPAAYLLMAGKMTAWIFGWTYPAGLLAAVLFSTIYIYAGGLRSVVRTDVFEFIIMYAGFVMMVLMLGSHYGGISFLRANVKPELFTPLGGQAFAAVFVWYIIASTTLIEPLFYERVSALEKERTALPGILMAIVFWAIFDFMTTTTGLYARALLPDLKDPSYAFPELARLVLPVGAFGFFLAALLATIMSTVNAYTFLAAKTLGQDLIWKGSAARDPNQVQPLVRRWLLVTTVAATLLALASDSIVNLWHGLGSIAAPVLLLPTLTSWSGKHAYPRRFVVLGMIASGLVSLFWQLWQVYMGGTYPFGIEPIYVGLGVSGVIYAGGRMFTKPQSAPGTEERSKLRDYPKINP